MLWTLGWLFCRGIHDIMISFQKAQDRHPYLSNHPRDLYHPISLHGLCWANRMTTHIPQTDRGPVLWCTLACPFVHKGINHFLRGCAKK